MVANTKCFRESGSKVHKTDLEKVVMCVCVQAHTGVHGEEGVFLVCFFSETTA